MTIIDLLLSLFAWSVFQSAFGHVDISPLSLSTTQTSIAEDVRARYYEGVLKTKYNDTTEVKITFPLSGTGFTVAKLGTLENGNLVDKTTSYLMSDSRVSQISWQDAMGNTGTGSLATIDIVSSGVMMTVDGRPITSLVTQIYGRRGSFERSMSIHFSPYSVYWNF